MPSTFGRTAAVLSTDRSNGAVVSLALSLAVLAA
jgi:hypothetical protein